MRSICEETKIFSSLLGHYIQQNFPSPKDYVHSYTEARIIHYLMVNQNHEIYQKELCDKLELKKATIAEILKDMEERGVIIRNSSAEDKRKKSVVLSAEVIEKEKVVQKMFSDLNVKLIENIEENDLEVFYRVLDQMKSNLK